MSCREWAFVSSALKNIQVDKTLRTCFQLINKLPTTRRYCCANHRQTDGGAESHVWISKRTADDPELTSIFFLLELNATSWTRSCVCRGSATPNYQRGETESGVASRQCGR